jgi:hypothetical protein
MDETFSMFTFRKVYPSFEGSTEVRGYSPEKHLIAAVLQRAVRDYLSSEEELITETTEWFFNDASVEPCTFPWVCETLDLEIGIIRGLITKKKETHKGCLAKSVNKQVA